MDQRIDPRDLLTTWRALSGSAGEGWQTIPIGVSGSVRIGAGRRKPDDMEAVLFHFPSWAPVPAEKLPSGRGFEVLEIEIATGTGAEKWLALVRQPPGTSDLFTMMATDVLSMLTSLDKIDAGSPGRAVLARIRAWQDFMRRGSDGVLDKESELGLAGELAVMCAMLDAGVEQTLVTEAWQGPLDGLHDYVFPGGSIEVKASLATAGFTARIGSLEQLDDSQCAPLFVAAVRHAADAAGATLPELVGAVRSRVPQTSGARLPLEHRLMHAGYVDHLSERYFRRFHLQEIRIHEVDACFPRLIPSNVPGAVRSARYELDFNQIQHASHAIQDVMTRIGAL